MVIEAHRFPSNHSSICARGVRTPKELGHIEIPGELGLSHSNELNNIVRELRCQLAERASEATAIVFPPNTPRYGFGNMRSSKDRKAGMKEAKKIVKDALEHPDNNFIVKEVSCIVDAESMYSTTRDHHLNFWQLISSETCPDTGDEKSTFAKGFTYCREAVPKMVRILPREEFRDWKEKFDVPSRGNLDPSLEAKSWHTSKHITETVLSFVFKGVGVNGSRRAQVRHITMWNAETAIGVMALNMQKLPHMPRLGYSGSTTQEGASQVCANVRKAIQDELLALADKGDYILPGFASGRQGSQGVESGSASARPLLKEDAFKLTCPRANGELPIRETELQKMLAMLSAVPALVKEFNDKVHKHNAEKNKSGVTFKVKRTSPEGALASVRFQPCLFKIGLWKQSTQMSGIRLHVLGHVLVSTSDTRTPD